MNLQQFAEAWLPEIEATIGGMVSGEREDLRGMYGMMRYHLGWENESGEPERSAQGKRIRPLVVLMACQAAGDEPSRALPAAAAVELVHNFSLIHDDIEDDSPTRRHRPTLWTWAGVAQAINTGDAMFILARLALLGLLETGVPATRVLWAHRVFDETCLHLTEGQYLDMSFENRARVSLQEYMAMITGKTAALLAASAQLGAITAGADTETAGHYWRYGHELGLSFQVQDDILGIWGDEAKTGKSAASDILTRKKTLPVLYALGQPGDDAAVLWRYYDSDRQLTEDDLPAILDLLDRLRAREYAGEAAREHAVAAMKALDATAGAPSGIDLLHELAERLLGRQV